MKAASLKRQIDVNSKIDDFSTPLRIPYGHKGKGLFDNKMPLEL